MFGTNDDNQQSNDDPAMLDNVKQLASEPAHAVEPPSQAFSPTTPSDPVTTSNFNAPNFSATHTAEPAQGFSSAPIIDDPITSGTTPSEPVVSDPSPLTTTDPSVASPFISPTSEDTSTSTPSTPVDQDHLAGMKQEALEHLEPLVEHLDGTPEETFKTTMMMIQANDNHTLLEKALEAAKKIEDDKVRAQAMLDIVNEINYFSQNTSSN
jgi:hypothetical protein